MCDYDVISIEPITRPHSPYKYRAICNNCGSAINGTTIDNTIDLFVENCTKEKVIVK